VNKSVERSIANAATTSLLIALFLWVGWWAVLIDAMLPLIVGAARWASKRQPTPSKPSRWSA